MKQNYSELEKLVYSRKKRILYSISVIVPFFNKDEEAFDKLLLTLASLSYQNYPKNLFDVAVAFDGPGLFSDFSENLYKELNHNNIDVSNITLVNAESKNENWGKGYAFNKVLASCHKELVLSLDSDMVLDRNYLKTLERWFISKSNLVVFGSKKIAPTYVSKVEALQALADDRFEDIPVSETKDHEWFANFIKKTDNFKQAGSSVFSIFVGAAVLMNRSFLQNLGGYDESMRLAEDTELGYRLHNAGAIFIPDLDSRAWHLGETTMTNHRDKLIEHNHSLLSQRVPLLRKLRKNKSHLMYKTPAVVVNIKGTEESATKVITLVNELLSGSAGFDTKINIVLPQNFSEERYSPLNDSFYNIRKMVNFLSFDERVFFSAKIENFDRNSPFVMVVNKPVPSQFLKKMFTVINAKDVGFVGLPSIKGDPIAVLYRQAALARLNVHDLSESLPSSKQIGNVWGFWWISRFEVVKKSTSQSASSGAKSLKKKILRKLRRLKNSINRK